MVAVLNLKTMTHIELNTHWHVNYPTIAKFDKGLTLTTLTSPVITYHYGRVTFTEITLRLNININTCEM